MQTQAQSTYKFRRMKIDNQIRLLQEKLNKMDKEQDANPKDWGYAGNVGHITEELTKILEFVDPTEDDEIF